MTNISFYGSHNCAYVVERDGKILEVIELERLISYKNTGLAQYRTPRSDAILYFAKWVPQYIMKKFNIQEFDNCYFLNTDVITDKMYYLERLIPAKKYIAGKHHESHAAASFYQSPYEEALIFSFDGGGNDGKFNVYTCKRGESPKILEAVINPLKSIPYIWYDLGFPYMSIAHFLGDIKYQDLSTGNLVYPGKLMGLGSYGHVKEEWLAAFKSYYYSDPSGTPLEDGTPDFIPKLLELGRSIGVDFESINAKLMPGPNFDIKSRIRGQVGYDIAATNQKAFEDCFLEVAKLWLEKYSDLPVCITGGCALNIILNTRIKTEFKRDIFVGPVPNDCGVALGLLLNHLKPEKPVDITYAGLPLLDLDLIGDYIQNTDINLNVTDLNIDQFAEDLISGRIIGIARGNSEHGARALGNRSILCNPCIPGMKDTLNAKVKQREWYRPFAPVVRLEDVSQYFDWDEETRWMSFCPTVKEEWRHKLSEITHIDNTARVQTVTREQNAWLYDLLTVIKQKTGIGMLLNTSFNVDGKPILTTVRDAFHILKNTQLDGIIIEDVYITKKWTT